MSEGVSEQCRDIQRSLFDCKRGMVCTSSQREISMYTHFYIPFLQNTCIQHFFLYIQLRLAYTGFSCKIFFLVFFVRTFHQNYLSYFQCMKTYDRLVFSGIIPSKPLPSQKKSHKENVLRIIQMDQRTRFRGNKTG